MEQHDLLRGPSFWHHPLLALSLGVGIAGGFWAGAVSSFVAGRARQALAQRACAPPQAVLAAPILPVVGPPPPAPVCVGPLGRGIRWTGTGYEVDRAQLERLVDQSVPLAASARIVPSIRDGRPNGFKIYAVRSCSLFEQLGLRNGDLIQSINGLDISSPDKALVVYQSLRVASDFSLRLERRGEELTLNYRLL